MVKLEFDRLGFLVMTTQRYLAGDITVEFFKSEFTDIIRDCSEDEMARLAHLISEFAIHLRASH